MASTPAMRLFEYAQDFYGDWLPMRLLWPAALLVLWAAVLFIGVHLIRRAAGYPVCSDPDCAASTKGRIPRYEIGARLYHWGNSLFIVGLVASAYALFGPRGVDPPVWDWLRIHEIFAALFIGGLSIHIVAALTRGQPRTMWFERQDWRDIKLIVANFVGRTRAYPCVGKYDPFQKIYHACLTLLGTVLIVSGVSMFLSAEVLVTFSHEWLRWQRLAHDLAAVTLVAMIVGHIYFSVSRVNWPKLASMFTGYVSEYAFCLYHTRKRWTPKRFGGP
jgi:cytochrome b subunit of formate dehydrogenase